MHACRVWLQSGDVAYRQGENAECLYVVISGRLRLVHESRHQITHRLSLHVSGVGFTRCGSLESSGRDTAVAGRKQRPVCVISLLKHATRFLSLQLANACLWLGMWLQRISHERGAQACARVYVVHSITTWA